MLMHPKIFTYNDPLPLPIKLSPVTLVPIPLNLPMTSSSPVAIFLPQLFQASSAQEVTLHLLSPQVWFPLAPMREQG